MATYRVNTIMLTVLSDEDISEWDVGRIIEECDTGCCVLAGTRLHSRAVPRAEMDEQLILAGSDPDFFSPEN